MWHHSWIRTPSSSLLHPKHTLQRILLMGKEPLVECILQCTSWCSGRVSSTTSGHRWYTQFTGQSIRCRCFALWEVKATANPDDSGFTINEVEVSESYRRLCSIQGKRQRTVSGDCWLGLLIITAPKGGTGMAKPSDCVYAIKSAEVLRSSDDNFIWYGSLRDGAAARY